MVWKTDRVHNFYPRPPRGGRPLSARLYASHRANFYPRPPRGGGLILLVNPQDYYEFLSTPSARRATAWERQKQPRYLFLSTPSARRATKRYYDAHEIQRISIHALREEGDKREIINPAAFASFLSTPSARRATQPVLPHRSCGSYFYPRPPRGGRPVKP